MYRSSFVLSLFLLPVIATGQATLPMRYNAQAQSPSAPPPAQTAPAAGQSIPQASPSAAPTPA